MFGSTLARKHMTAFFLLVAIPVALVIAAFSFLFRQEAVRIARNRTAEAVERSAQNLDTEAQNFALFTSALMNDDALMEYAKTYASSVDPKTRYLAAQGIETSISWFFRITSRMGSVYIFFEDGQYFPYSNYSSSNIDFTATRALCLDSSRPLGEVWCIDDLRLPSSAVRQPPSLSLSVSPRPNDLTSAALRAGVAAILVSFRIPFLDRMYEGNAGFVGDGYVVNRRGDIILGGQQESIGKAFASLRRELGSRYLLIDAELPSTGWTFAESIPVRYFTRNLDVMMRFVAVAIALISLLFVFYTHSFFADIIDPLRALIAQMGKVSGGDFSVRARIEGPVEFRRLGTAFNAMVVRLDQLTTQIVEEQRERTKAEIEALRFQLNPHFVCNTLNAIGMMASIAKADSIARMTKALTRIMRETLSVDDTIFSFEDELKNLESYVYIMKIRFGDTFEFRTEIEDGLLRAGIPTMLLQPLVENAILHGLRGREAGGTVIVAASRRGDYVHVEVRDDGVGMNEEKRTSLFAEPRESRSGLNRIGLYNIRRRIVLSYGPPCEVRIESFPGEGTVVTLTLPLLPAPAPRKSVADAANEVESGGAE